VSRMLLSDLAMIEILLEWDDVNLTRPSKLPTVTYQADKYL